MTHTVTTWRQKFPHIPAPSRFPSALRFSQTPRVNLAGQCCPHRDTYMLAWQTLPPGGLGINKALSNFWISVPPEGVNHGSSSKSTRDRLTKSSRLADFCSSSDSFYGLNSSVGLSCACTVSTILLISASLDHPLVHCCPPNSLTLSLSFHLTSFYSPSALFMCLRHSLRVAGQKLIETEGAFLLGVDRVPPAAGKVDPRVVLCQLGHIPSICHHLVRTKSTTNPREIFITSRLSVKQSSVQLV